MCLVQNAPEGRTEACSGPRREGVAAASLAFGIAMRNFAVIAVTIAFGNVAAYAGTFVVGAFVDVAARRLQSNLPACAVDELIEAHRHSGQWTFKFWLTADKASVKEVRISLRQVDASSSKIGVEVVEMKKGLLFDSEDTLRSESLEWTTLVNRLLDNAGGASVCAGRSQVRSSAVVQ